MAGKNVQLPTVGAPEFTRQQFLQGLQEGVFNMTLSGPTTSRPTSTLPGRWIGMPYFDTDLGYQINLRSVNPDVWVDANGVLV
jgi:hypothetical protein